MAKPEQQPAGEQPAVMTYRCPDHARFFPQEDERRPVTEFRHDPVTLRLIHDAYCKRCARARKRAYTRNKAEWRYLPDLVRIQQERARAEAELSRLTTGGQVGKVTQEGLLFQLDHLAREEQKFQAAATEQAKEEDTAAE